jgi:hypothetical protein
MKKNTITIYTVAYGEHWERYGKQWEENMKKLDPQPDEIFIVTDKDIETDFKYYIFKSDEIADYRNFAIEKTTSEMVCSADIDDIFYTNYIANIKFNVDVHIFSFDCPKNNNAREMKSEEMLRQTYFLPPHSAIKTEIVKKIKYSIFGWEDRVLCKKLFDSEANLHYGKTKRFIWTSCGPNKAHGWSSLTFPKTDEEYNAHRKKTNEWLEFLRKEPINYLK